RIQAKARGHFLGRPTNLKYFKIRIKNMKTKEELLAKILKTTEEFEKEFGFEVLVKQKNAPKVVGFMKTLLALRWVLDDPKAEQEFRKEKPETKVE
ncbi:unnamed protein product, partial [marine sediment metagenome]